MTFHPIRVGVTVPPAHTTYPAFIQAVRQAEAVVRSLAAPGPPLLAAAGAGTRREAL